MTVGMTWVRSRWIETLTSHFRSRARPVETEIPRPTGKNVGLRDDAGVVVAAVSQDHLLEQKKWGGAGCAAPFHV